MSRREDILSCIDVTIIILSLRDMGKTALNLQKFVPLSLAGLNAYRNADLNADLNAGVSRGERG